MLNRRLLASWLTLLLGALLLAARYPALPDAIPAYRSLLGTPLGTLPKSPFSVFRIVAMGVGQLGAATVMTRVVTRAQQRHWVTFWTAAAMAAGAKTFIESVQYALLGAAGPTRIELAYVIAALLPVAAFLVVAGRLWRTRRLEPPQAIPSLSIFALAAFFLLWLVFALLPRFLIS